MKDAAARLAQVRLRRIRIARELRLAKEHPAHLLERMSMVDEKTGEIFRFHLIEPGPAPSREKVPAGQNGWYWQRAELERMLALPGGAGIIWLKARQLGLTWLCAGYQLADALRRPGTRHLVFRQKEDDAAEIIGRQWQMYCSLPEHLRFGTEVVTPRSGQEPNLLIELKHPDGRISTIRGMASTEQAAHGPTAATILLDEGSRIERLRGIWTAIGATIGTVGKAFIVSTANGRASVETEEGNFYHLLWQQAEERGLEAVFLGWFTHPDRDQDWYDNSPETRKLDVRARAEQYPDNALEPFALTENVYFDREALTEYGARLSKRLERFTFEEITAEDGSKQARMVKSDTGLIDLYVRPNPKHAYAIGADVATGRGADWSAAYVIDLDTMELCAQFRGKLDLDLYATQLHYLGKMFRGRYEAARLAIETATGHGDAVIIPLRDGREGRPPYPRLHRHVHLEDADRGRQRAYGFPMRKDTRLDAIELLEKALRERLLPAIPGRLLAECESFVHKDTGTTPRAQDGHADDCVIAAAITFALYRLYGHHAAQFRRPPRRRRPSHAEVLLRQAHKERSHVDRP